MDFVNCLFLLVQISYKGTTVLFAKNFPGFDGRLESHTSLKCTLVYPREEKESMQNWLR